MTSIRHTLQRHRVAVVTAFLGVLALLVMWSLVVNDLGAGSAVAVDWPAFALISVMLLACERSPSAWIRLGPVGVVTPLWMFAFGLSLVGSPSLAVCVAVLGATIHGISQAETASQIAIRASGTAISLASAGLVLLGLGVRGSIARLGSLPWQWAAAIVLAGVTIVLLNTWIAALTIATRRRIRFLGLLRRSLAIRITAEGALLSLAPLWVIGVDFGLVLAPLLGITTALVFRSTRQALERSHEAYHDQLTGLINRRSFLESLEETLGDPRSAIRPTILVMDLNGFKDINDRLGHQLGDSVLIGFADRLQLCLPTDATSARFGGDEFAVLLVDTPDRIERAIRDLRRAIGEPLIIEGFPVTIGVSIGVASYPSDGLTSRDLLRASDVAMYKAKRTGTDVAYYETCANGPQRGRLNLLGDLGAALENHELHIHFQPQLRLSDGEVDTVEALIRWQHPEHGSIPPDEFIGLAEQTDLIAPITELVLRVATRGLVNSGVTSRLAVNVSPRNLQDPDFATTVLTILQEAGFRPDRLELEVTERSIVSNAERCRYTIEKLRSQGVRIAIDDFGVGYSSFHALRVLEVDRVKIDRTFVQGVLQVSRDRSIVAGMIRLAHDLGLDVVAEGVESTELWHALADLGCDVAQGYGIARPMGYPELRGWLSGWSEVLIERVPGTGELNATPMVRPRLPAANPTIPA